METANKCKNCIHWNRQHSTVGICSELTKLKIESKEIVPVTHSVGFNGFPIVGFSSVATGEDYGKDCPHFAIIGYSNLDRKNSLKK